MGRYAFPVISRLLHLVGGHFPRSADSDRALFWYIHSALWGRFAGSTETVLNQDYEAATRSGVDGLISTLERWRGGNLSIDGQDFEGSGGAHASIPCSTCSPGYAAPVTSDRPPLAQPAAGAPLQPRGPPHLPQGRAVRRRLPRAARSTQSPTSASSPRTPIWLSERRPEDYLPAVEKKHPGVLALPVDPGDHALWQIDRYPDFLAARRELLAGAANSFLGELRTGTASGANEVLERQKVLVETIDDQDARPEEIAALIVELTELGCAEPAVDCEISDPGTGKVLAIAEACWPEGLQPGQGNPVVLELDPEESDLARLEELGYKMILPQLTRSAAMHAAVIRKQQGPLRNRPAQPKTSAILRLGLIGEPGLDVRAEFERAMKDVYIRAKSEANYTASYFIGMLSSYGGLGTAQRLLASTEVSSGFAALYERDRLDLTVEALVIQSKFASLFTDEELDIARPRLDQLGYR